MGETGWLAAGFWVLDFHPLTLGHRVNKNINYNKQQQL